MPDLIAGVFNLPRPDVGWVGDITYIPTDEGWLYLASVLDLASRRVVGWSMGEHHDAALVSDALRSAVATRGRARMDGTIFHSDRGSEPRFKGLSQRCRLRPDLCDPRHPPLGGPHRDLLRQRRGRIVLRLAQGRARSTGGATPPRAQARLNVFAWINRYNTRRLHSAIGYLPPTEWEHNYPLSAHLLGDFVPVVGVDWRRYRRTWSGARVQPPWEHVVGMLRAPNEHEAHGPGCVDGWV